MNQVPLDAAPTAFKDRRTGLIVFGILVIFIGCVCALMIPLMVFGHMMSAKTLGAETSFRMLLPATAMYGLLAVVFIWLGVGSIRARRWARALLLVLSWAWLLVGIFSQVMMAVIFPRILATKSQGGPEIPQAMNSVILAVTMGCLGVIYILLPGLLVLFYGGKNVKATCELRDPIHRWTDRCPLPVLSLSLLLAFSAFSILPMMATYRHVVPVFGLLVTGVPATLCFLFSMAVMGYCAWGIYHLKPLAWWITTLGYALATTSALTTFARIDLLEFYRKMGCAEPQLAQIQQLGFLTGEYFAWSTGLIAVPVVSCLLYLKRFFRNEA